MPFYHKQREFTPLLIAAQKKAIRNGHRHAIYTSRFDKYVGEWKNDVKEGKGRFLTIEGKLYQGDWYNGFRHGFGLLSQLKPNGVYDHVYRGYWVRGKPEGPGHRKYENGNIYLGFWKKGMMHGFGNMWYAADGTYYVGYWNKDMREGLGLYLLENGNRYEGHWEKNVKSGIGRFYHMRTGQLQEGCWENDVCVKSKITDILIRQACECPTPYPIPPVKVKFSKSLLEFSEFWMKQKVGEIDKNLKFCIDQM